MASRNILGSVTESIKDELEEDERNPAAARPIIWNRPKHSASQTVELAAVTRQLDQLKTSHAGGFMVRLSNVRISPYQLSPIIAERVQALVENLKSNPLTTPVVVRPTEVEGVFELVAGHHRLEAFRILAREEIPAVCRELSDDEAERLVFYDNLLAPTLSDYEKYAGFSARRKSKKLSHEQLASESGLSAATIQRLMSFERLPAGAQELIRLNPRASGLSQTLFASLSVLSEKYAQRVVEAVQRVIDGKLAATAAADWVTANRAAPTQADRVVVRSGKKKFAEIRTRGTQWVVNFASEEDAVKCAEKLLGVVQQQASEGD